MKFTNTLGNHLLVCVSVDVLMSTFPIVSNSIFTFFLAYKKIRSECKPLQNLQTPVDILYYSILRILQEQGGLCIHIFIYILCSFPPWNVELAMYFKTHNGTYFHTF